MARRLDAELIYADSTLEAFSQRYNLKIHL